MRNYYDKYVKYKTKYYNVAYGGNKQDNSINFFSTAFKNGENIPEKYTCDGASFGVKIPLVWSNLPALTKSLAITIVVPDAPNGHFVHWIAWNIAPTVHNLDENFTNYNTGENSSGKTDYIGPCPPYNHGTHRYIITIYALDITPATNIKNYAQLKNSMVGHVVGQGVLMGKYARFKT